MLSTEEFRTFAKDVVPFLHVTSRIEGEKYGNLLQEKGGTGFPYVVAMDAEGNVISVLEDRTVEGFRAMMKSGAEFQALLAKKDRTPADELALLTMELKLERVKPDEARARAAKLTGLDEAAKKKLDGLLLGLDVRAEIEKLGRSPDAAAKAAAGTKFADWWAAGREPSSDEDGFQPFFIFMLDHAEAAKDAALFEKALEKLRAKFGENPRAAGFFKKQDERLAKLRSEEAPK